MYDIFLAGPGCMIFSSCTLGLNCLLRAYRDLNMGSGSSSGLISVFGPRLISYILGLGADPNRDTKLGFYTLTYMLLQKFETGRK